MGKSRSPERWLVSDQLWSKVQPLLPKPPRPARWRGGRPRVPDRHALNGILFVLRTGCQWNALNATGICSSSTAHRRFQQWVCAGVFAQLWEQGLTDYDELNGIDWRWQAMDGAMTKAPLGGEKIGPNPTDRATDGVKRSVLTEGAGVPIGLAIDGANRNDCKLVKATLESIPVERPVAGSGQLQGLCLDKGYDCDEVRELAATFGYTTHMRSRGEEAQALKRKTRF